MARRFRAVQGGGRAGQPAERRFRPGGELDTFIADLNAGVARVALALVLLDQGRARPRCCCSEPRSAEVRLAGSDPPAIAEAMKAALVAVLRRTESGRRSGHSSDAGSEVRPVTRAVCFLDRGQCLRTVGKLAAAGSGNGGIAPAVRHGRDCACSRAAARAAARSGGSSSCPDPAARSSSPCRTPPNRARRTDCAGSRRCCRCRTRQQRARPVRACAAAGEQQQDQQVSHSDSIRPVG